MPTIHTAHKYYFWVEDEIACAGTVRDIFELGIAEAELRKSKPEWAKGNLEIWGARATPAEAKAWLKRQQQKGIPTPLESVRLPVHPGLRRK